MLDSAERGEGDAEYDDSDDRDPNDPNDDDRELLELDENDERPPPPKLPLLPPRASAEDATSDVANMQDRSAVTRERGMRECRLNMFIPPGRSPGR
ncbi:hypothetical protein [Burkholderia ubonensis]|uniref:hypothetical protein n=1 Tax=Burkholderia ubonensis TaxID=101571 RepID=UPI000A68CDA9|nr:hypothetical protein [Burkholderia ubonensis]